MDEYRTVFLMLLVAMSNYVVAVQLHYIYFSQEAVFASKGMVEQWKSGKMLVL